MMDDEGVVIGIEHIPELVKLSVKNISKHHSELMKSGKIMIIEGDGRKGYEDKAPYNCIHVGAGNIYIIILFSF